jgi:hypothetical protein
VVFRDVHQDYLVIIEHSEEVDDVWILSLEENLAMLIYMNYGFISSRIDHL